MDGGMRSGPGNPWVSADDFGHWASNVDNPYPRECHITGTAGGISVQRPLRFQRLPGQTPYFNHIELQFRQYRRFW
jgi:hypothetical protein